MYILPFLGLRASILREKVQNVFLEPVPKVVFKTKSRKKIARTRHLVFLQ